AIDAMAGEAGKAFNAIVEDLTSLTSDHVAANRRAHDEVLTALANSNLVSIAGSIAATLLAVVIAWTLSRNISLRLRALTAVASDVTRGELDRRAPVEGGDEIGELAGAFNEMTSSLARLLEEQRQAAEEQGR